jgi:acyl-CoA reductase-like NAD-dependent aldehyde dehydrogenase
MRCISPVDGSVYAERPFHSETEVEQALDRAARAQRLWKRASVKERAGFCTAAVEAMLAMGDDIVPELAWQMGRPVKYGRGEMRGFEERARYMIAIADEALRDLQPGDSDDIERFMRREPLGTVFVIAPWNYPYLTAVNSVIPALMAGNAVILKHSAQTLLVGERFQTAFDRAGLLAGLFQNLRLDHEQARRVIQSGRIQQVNFTGSVEGGRTMERAAAGFFLGMGLELGGKDPAYVRADCDLPSAIENLGDGAFFNSGQSCCGIERIYVAEPLFDEFVAGVVAFAKQYVLGNPLDPATTLGPMIAPKSADFVRGQIAEAVKAGATAHIDQGAYPQDRKGSAYLSPQVLTAVNHTMSVMTEESFGPVVGIMPVSDDAEAIALMNDSRFGLTGSIWTRDAEAARVIGSQLETGTVFMNRCDYLDPALAWTGVKETGRGASLSRVGYETLTRPKSFHLRHAT